MCSWYCWVSLSLLLIRAPKRFQSFSLWHAKPKKCINNKRAPRPEQRIICNRCVQNNKRSTLRKYKSEGLFEPHPMTLERERERETYGSSCKQRTARCCTTVLIQYLFKAYLVFNCHKSNSLQTTQNQKWPQGLQTVTSESLRNTEVHGFSSQRTHQVSFPNMRPDKIHKILVWWEVTGGNDPVWQSPNSSDCSKKH